MNLSDYLPQRPALDRNNGQVFDPGYYVGVANEVYRAAQGISKSDLDKLHPTPMHFLRPSPPPTKAMEIGTAVHTAILEPENMGVYSVKPEGLDGRTKEGKEWVLANAGKLILSHEEATMIAGVAQSVTSHPMWSIYQNPANEVSVFQPHSETGLMRKGRLDRVAEDGEGRLTIIDIKTTDDASKFDRSISDFRYYVQAAYYTDLIADAMLIEQPNFVFFVVEKQYPHCVRVVRLDQDWIALGRITYTNDLHTYARCVASMDFGGYPETAEELSPKPWHLNTL